MQNYTAYILLFSLMCNTQAYVSNNPLVISCMYNKVYKFILQMKLNERAKHRI